MALGEVQTALARLLTDTAARAMFARDPLSAGRSLGLDEADARSVAALPPHALDRYGASLKSKRALDARKLLPLTALALGDDFAPRLREVLPARPGGAVADAIALVSRLAADTAASPDRNVSSRTVMTARASAPSSHGGPPTARARNKLR